VLTEAKLLQSTSFDAISLRLKIYCYPHGELSLGSPILKTDMIKSVETVRGIIEYLNQRSFEAGTDNNGHDRPFDLGAENIHADYAGFQLGSLFQPIVRLTQNNTLTIVAHEAFLAAHTETGILALGNVLSPNVVFALPKNDMEMVTLDRLARTLHTLNFLLQEAPNQLHLNVHPQHLLAVESDHGQVFEQILRQCGLEPTSIVLEIPEQSIKDKRQLRIALRGWQSRGYRIAFDQLNIANGWSDRTLELTPNIIKIEKSLIHSAEKNSRERNLLERLVAKASSQGIEAIATGIETRSQQTLAEALGFKEFQGYLHSRPASHCQPLLAASVQNEISLPPANSA
jgi:EAL domain-containing protein (putative c-di-GMP-specific phosphodiesterase class I)